MCIQIIVFANNLIFFSTLKRFGTNRNGILFKIIKSVAITNTDFVSSLELTMAKISWDSDNFLNDKFAKWSAHIADLY